MLISKIHEKVDKYSILRRLNNRKGYFVGDAD